jgi:hypothetical protein
VWYVLYTVAALLFWLQHSLSPGQFNRVNHPIGRGEMPERGQRYRIEYRLKRKGQLALI